MAIALRSSNGYIEFNSGASNTSHTINISDAAVGDVRFMCANWSPDGTGTLPSHPSITGWTQIGTSTATGAASNSRLSLYYRVVQSGDTLTSATVGVTLSATAWAMVCSFTLEGVDTASVLDQTTPTMATGSATTQPCPAITTTTDGAWVVHVAIQDGTGLITDGDEPGTDTLLGTINGNPPSNGACIGCSYVVEATAGSSPSASWNSGTSEEYVAATFAVSPSSGASVSPTDLDMDESSVTLTGSGFGATQGTGTVYISDANTLAGSDNEVDIDGAISTWSDTSISLNLGNLTAAEKADINVLGPGTRYFIIYTNGATEIPSEDVSLHRAEAFVISLSSNFAAGSTTAQLTAPATKTTGDMDGGRIEEAANPSATTTNVTTDDYREDEWCFKQKTNARAVAYEFRGTIAGAAYTTYTEVPAISLQEESGIKVRVAPFSLRTTAGTQDITITDLGAVANIKGALFYCSGATSLDTVADHARASIGGTDKTNTFVCHKTMEDASNPTVVRRGTWSTGDVIRIYSGGGTLQASASINSWITNGVRLDVTNGTSSALKGHIVFFADSGSDLQVDVITQSFSASTTMTVSSMSFEPELVIDTLPNLATNNSNNTPMKFGHGAVINKGGTLLPQKSHGVHSDHNATPSDCGVIFNTKDAYQVVNDTASQMTVNIDQFSSTGFVCTASTSTSTTHNFFCISTGGKANLGLYHYTGPTSAASDWQSVDASITPQAVIGLQSAADAADTFGDTDELSSCFYAFDKDSNIASIGTTEDHGQTASNTCSWASSTRAIWTRQDDQAGDWHLMLTPSIIPGGFEFPAAQITTANATARYGWAIVISDVMEAAGTEVLANTDTLTLTEYAATITLDVDVQANVDALTLTENQATVNAETNLTTNVDALTLTEYAATIVYDVDVLASTDALTLTTQQANVNAAINISAGTDALTLATYQATVNAATNIETNLDALTLTTYSASVSGDTNVSANVANLTLTEHQANVNAETSIQANVDTLALTTNQATVNAETNVQASVDALSLTTYAAQILADVNIQANVDALTLTENTATINAGLNISANTDALTLTTYAASLNIQASTDALTLTEHQAAVVFDAVIEAGVDNLALTEHQATINAGAGIQANPDVLILTEYAATVNAETNVQAAVDALTLTEQSASVNAETNVNAATDALTITTYNASLSADRIVQATVDALTLTTHTATISADKNISASTDALTLTTYQANVYAGVNTNVDANVDALTLTTYSASIAGDVNVQASTDALTLTEQTAEVSLDITIQSVTDALTLTEYQASVSFDVNIQAGVAALSINEYGATLSYDRNISASTDTLTLTAHAATIVVGEPSAISDIIVGRQMIARSTDTAFPIEAAVSEGGGVAGLSIDISIRDANAPTYYLDFNDNTMKTSGWVSKTKALSDYGSGFYGTTINVSTISGLSENHLSVEYDISGASVGITNSLVSIEDYGLTSTQDANLSTILGELTSIEAGYDHSELMRGIMAMVANKLSGAIAGSTGTAAIRDIADSKDRITINYDQHGNRTGSTLNDLT